jgi:hypothetical protein
MIFATTYIGKENSTLLTIPSDGILRLNNWNENDFNRLQFGGGTTSFPALKRAAAALETKLADDSAYAQHNARQYGLVDGVAAPTAVSGRAHLYIDSADGNPKIQLGSGVVRPLAAGLVLVEQKTAASSASLDFTAGITSAYDDYLIELIDLIPATTAVVISMQFSLNGGSSWETTNYKHVRNYMSDAGTTGTQIDDTPLVGLAASTSNSASGGVSGSLRFHGPLAASPNKVLHGRTMFLHSSGTRYVYEHRLWYLGGAVNALRFIASSGNIASGTVRLYGLTK